jgi:4-hydroxybenzoate polyprenyltransferase
VHRPFHAGLRLLRPHQWAKNALAVLPAALAHRLGEPAVLADTALAVVALSLCASGTYVVNDWLDRDRDRRHPTKRNRPLASGAISPGTGLVIAVVLVAGAFGLAAATLPPAFSAVLVVYVVTTLAYSFRLKAVAVLDVLVLAGLYALRVVAGGEASGTPVSEWLLAFSLFFFLALALLKRYTELRQMETGAAPADNGRGYEAEDAAIVRGIGPACGLLAVLVLALYATSPAVRVLYSRPELLWLITPALLYWTMRMWLLAHRGQMPDDPVLFAVKDPVSYVVVALVAAVLAVAS